MPDQRFTNFKISKTNLALLNQLEAKEAGKRGMGGMKHDDFIVLAFLVHAGPE